MKFGKLMAVVLAGGMLLAGCGTNGGSGGSAEGSGGASGTGGEPGGVNKAVLSNEPVTLRVFQDLTGITDDEFNTIIAAPVKKVYPNVTMELVRRPKDVTVNDLILQGNFPDLIYASSIDIDWYNQSNLLVPLDDMVKKAQVDLSRFEQGAIETIRAYSPQNKLLAFPIFLEYGLNYYNKDIFDKFGVSYPKDGMTWEQTVDLAKKVSRLDNDQPFYGLQTPALPRLSVSLRIPIVDQKTEKAVLTTTDWKDALDLFKTVKNMQTDLGKGLPGVNYQKGNLAMNVAYFGFLGTLEEMAKKGEPLNWDIAQFPVWKNNPMSEGAAVTLMLTSQGKHQDLALEVAKLLTTNENQEIIAKQAKKPVIKNTDAIIKNFGANLVSLKGKNVGAIFKGKVEKNPLPTIYDRYVKDVINKQMPKALTSNDLNSSLRTFEEEANKAIEENK
jgi:multiple sugar transport system substrate-binding protein